jgi:hypothetical protein
VDELVARARTRRKSLYRLLRTKTRNAEESLVTQAVDLLDLSRALEFPWSRADDTLSGRR